MATVYLARSRGGGGFERDVALKLTHAHLRDTDDFANDLLEEAKLVVRIRHPNVVPVLDADDDPLGVFLAMEYVEGDSLGGLRRRADKAGSRVPPRVGVRVLLDALAGLHAAHELKDEAGAPLELVHRDFSPQNILVGVDGVAKLTDFGIAKAASRLGTTRAGLVKGKITYMAPEQARSLALDRRCDVWAAGVIAWELFAGRRLYASDNEVGTLLKIVTEPPPLLRAIAPDVPEAIEAAVARALTLSLERRVPSAQAFARELAQACSAHGQLAEHEEVAAYLQTAVGARLAKRRARAAEIQRIRGRGSQPSLTPRDVPPPAASSSSLLDDLESSQSGPVLVPAAPKLPKEATPAVSEDDVLTVAPPPYPSSPSIPPEIANASSHVTDLTSASGGGGLGNAPFAIPEPIARLARDRRAQALVGALAFAAILGGAALVSRPRAASDDVPIASASATSPATAPASAPPPPASEAAIASGAPSAAAVPRRAELLRVVANTPITSLRVDDRDVPVDRDARAIDLELTSAERSRTLKLHAVASDGREATTLVPVGASSAELAFREVKAPAPARPAAPRKAPVAAGTRTSR